LSLKRNPNGINDPGFYQKDAGEHVPEFVKVFPYDNEEKIIEYIICNNEATLLYRANLGCIEMNPWNNRYNKTDKPDWLAIDIDPGDNNTFKQVILVAQAAKKMIDKAGLTAYCKTSGASGIHIFIPLHAQYDYGIVKNFGAFFMQQVEQMLPDITTLQRTKSKRGKKIYLDFLQNRRGQTLASVYSIRPVPGATVSAPIKWSELKESLSPSFFTIENMAGRVKKMGDLFKPVLTEKNNLIKALKLLNNEK
jgi:bifunctional non-homologous end joining protein LigD